MDEKDPKTFCYMIRKGIPCVKTKVAKRHLEHYQCESCIWRIHSEGSRHLNALKVLFEKYSDKKWD